MLFQADDYSACHSNYSEVRVAGLSRDRDGLLVLRCRPSILGCAHLIPHYRPVCLQQLHASIVGARTDPQLLDLALPHHPLLDIRPRCCEITGRPGPLRCVMQIHRIVSRPFADKGFLHILFLETTFQPRGLGLHLDFVMVVMTSQIGGVGCRLPAQSWKVSTGTGPGTWTHLQREVSIIIFPRRWKTDGLTRTLRKHCAQSSSSTSRAAKKSVVSIVDDD